MLKGLALTPPIIGRIAIGKVIERHGKRLPHKDDEFTITTQIQDKDGWITHPLNEALRKEGQKLRSIPIRLLFDDPELNFRVSYSLFDRQSGRPLCVGDGQRCHRVTSTGMQTLPCPTPMACPIGASGHCKPYGRLHVRIPQESVHAEQAPQTNDPSRSPLHDDELGSFVFRTTGFNSIRTLATRMRYFAAVSGGILASMNLQLKLRGKSTTLSHRAPIYYVDIITPAGLNLEEAVRQAKQHREHQMAGGMDQSVLDTAARSGYAMGEFEESDEEVSAVVDEFFTDAENSDAPSTGESSGTGGQPSMTPSLAHKLHAKASSAVRTA